MHFYHKDISTMGPINIPAFRKKLFSALRLRVAIKLTYDSSSLLSSSRAGDPTPSRSQLSDRNVGDPRSEAENRSKGS